MRNACYNISELEDVHICMSNCICTRILPNIEFAYFALKLEDVSEEKFFAWADLEADRSHDYINGFETPI